MTKRLNLYCQNPDCPHLRIQRKPRHLGEAKPGQRQRIKCSDCKWAYIWNGLGKLEEVGTLILEDVIICPNG